MKQKVSFLVLKKVLRRAGFFYALRIESGRSRKMLKNDYLDTKIGVDTADNEPSKVF